MGADTKELTQLLVAWGKGDEAALAQLTPIVEAELHKLARYYMNRERQEHTLQATALVNEAFVRLIDGQAVEWQNRAHFFRVAAQSMRHILVDHARRRRYQKRGGEAVRVSLTNLEQPARLGNAGLVELDDALSALAKFDERKSQVVELRFFGGLTEKEIAEVLKIPLRTAQREWSLARAWLYRELSKNASE